MIVFAYLGLAVADILTIIYGYTASVILAPEVIEVVRALLSPGVRNNPVNLVDPSGYTAADVLVPLAYYGSQAFYFALGVGAIAGVLFGLAKLFGHQKGSPDFSHIIRDTGERFLKPLAAPTVQSAQQLSHVGITFARGAQAAGDRTREVAEKLLDQGRQVALDLGVSAGRAADTVAEALTSPQAKQIGRGVNAYLGILGGTAQIGAGATLIAFGEFPLAGAVGVGLVLNGLADFSLSAYNFGEVFFGGSPLPPNTPNTTFEALARALTVKQSEAVQSDAQDIGKIANLSRGLIPKPEQGGILSKSLSLFSSAKHIIYSAGKLARVLFR